MIFLKPYSNILFYIGLESCVCNWLRFNRVKCLVVPYPEAKPSGRRGWFWGRFSLITLDILLDLKEALIAFKWAIAA